MEPAYSFNEDPGRGVRINDPGGKKTLHRYIEAEDTAGLSIEESVIEGDPGEGIFKLIEQDKIDLLVMVAHQQEHIEHFISGRDIHALVRKMPCSVLLVRRELEYEHFVT